MNRLAELTEQHVELKAERDTITDQLETLQHRLHTLNLAELTLLTEIGREYVTNPPVQETIYATPLTMDNVWEGMKVRVLKATTSYYANPEDIHVGDVGTIKRVDTDDREVFVDFGNEITWYWIKPENLTEV